MISSLGTSIMPAFSLAEEYFGTHSKSRLVVLISDGEDHQGVDMEAITAMHEKGGMRVAVVGIGTTAGGPIPLKTSTGQIQDYKKDGNGEIVLTKMDAATLKKVAQAGGGLYIDGFDTRKVVKRLNQMLNQLEKTISKGEVYTEYEYQFQPFLVLAIVFCSAIYSYFAEKHFGCSGQIFSMKRISKDETRIYNG